MRDATTLLRHQNSRIRVLPRACLSSVRPRLFRRLFFVSVTFARSTVARANESNDRARFFSLSLSLSHRIGAKGDVVFVAARHRLHSSRTSVPMRRAEVLRIERFCFRWSRFGRLKMDLVSFRFVSFFFNGLGVAFMSRLRYNVAKIVLLERKS